MKARFCFVLFLLVSAFGLAQDWELKIDEDAIKVYTRKLDSTQFDEFKAVLRVKTTPEKALSVILDGDRLWEWNHKTSDSETVLRYNDTSAVVWMLNDLPWPLRDRENLSLIRVSHPKPDTYHVTIDPADNSLKKQPENVIRTTKFKGHWHIEALGGGLVEVTQQLYGDPNGMIPAWLLNSILVNVPFQSFENLKLILEK